MKYFGDISKEHLELVDELVTLENWFKRHGSTIDPILAAKGHTCMAADYYSIFFDEEGDRLLNIAESCYPGYFKNAVFVHTRNDPEFAQLVTELKNSLALETLISLGFRDGSIAN